MAFVGVVFHESRFGKSPEDDISAFLFSSPCQTTAIIDLDSNAPSILLSCLSVLLEISARLQLVMTSETVSRLLYFISRRLDSRRQISILAVLCFCFPHCWFFCVIRSYCSHTFKTTALIDSISSLSSQHCRHTYLTCEERGLDAEKPL